MERGWCPGSGTFQEEILAAAGERVGRSHYGAERQESGEAKAQRLVREGLHAMRWTEKELSRRRKGDKGKVKLARQLRMETMMTLTWIAGRLNMGAAGSLANLLRDARKE